MRQKLFSSAAAVTVALALAVAAAPPSLAQPARVLPTPQG